MTDVSTGAITLGVLGLAMFALSESPHLHEPSRKFQSLSKQTAHVEVTYKTQLASQKRNCR